MAAYALTTSPVLPRPSLAERAAALRTKLTRRSATTPSATRTALLTAYAEAQAAYPICEFEEHGTPRYRAAADLSMRLTKLVSSIIETPTPTTCDGLATFALATAIHAEGLARSHWDNGTELAAAARALVALTGAPLPLTFLGYGDEPEYGAREEALLASPGRLPAWAQVEAAPAA